MAKLLRVDKNGTKYWLETKCQKCGGTGFIVGYEHVDGGRCFDCGGSGYGEHTWKEYTPEMPRSWQIGDWLKQRSKHQSAMQSCLKGWAYPRLARLMW